MLARRLLVAVVLVFFLPLLWHPRSNEAAHE
jgi:hypothetical protein